MPKIYYALGGQKFEVAKVTLENYEKVLEWLEGKNTSITIEYQTKLNFLNIHKVGKMNLNLYEDAEAYIIRRVESNSFEVMCQEDYTRMDWRPEHYLMQLFQYKHLPEHLQVISKPICELAEKLDSILPNNPEKTTALRKLRECKDCAVTATIFK